MKQQLKQIVQRVDAMTLRERIFMFVTATLGLILLVNWLVLDPQFARQKKLADQVKQNQATMAAIESGIQQTLKSREVDPDASSRERLLRLRQQSAQLQNGLLAMQKGLVPPDKMASLLEDILKRNGKLQLISLKTLPVADINEEPRGASKNAASKTAETASATVSVAKDDIDAQTATGAIYKHGVEMTVQGNYLDMVAYLSELEAMPWQLFWGSAKLNVDVYPKSTLTLTVFTLSLDKKWLNL